jgi:hypothetical protein
MKHIIAILPALIIALGLCGSAWIYACATRYAPAGEVAHRLYYIDHWTGKIWISMP